MSSGPADCAAEGALYRAVWNAVYDLRKLLSGERWRDRWHHYLVMRVNEIIADQGYQFELAQYAEARANWGRQHGWDELVEALWVTAFKLREALKWANVGHRGWSPHIDPEVDGLLRGTGYELREVQ
ncbi:MAG: hypothetical protein AMXMBFR56_62160 [Polyangiaceae bacterium]